MSVGAALDPRRLVEVLRRSVRARLTLAGSVTLLVGLTVGAFAFAQLFERQLVENLDASLRSLATDRARSIDAGLDPETQLATELTESAVAVFSVDGSLMANRGFLDPDPLTDLSVGVAESQSLGFVESGEAEVELHDVRLYAAQPGQSFVVVAAELEQVSNTVNQARALLAIGIPLITAAGAVLLWFVVGRALQPVDRMRRDAQAIVDLGGEPHGSGTRGRVHDPGTEDELGRLASTLNDMLERLDANAVAMRRFVSDSSHEIRTPIANIRARIETASQADWADARADVVGEVERMEAIVDDLTYLARRDEGRTAGAEERVELDELLFSEAARLQQQGRVSVDASGIEPLVVRGEPSSIERAIRNLVANAERHAAGVVRLAASEVDGVAVIDVDDDGPGIPAAERERVFERFVRLDESRQRGSGGTGLGLAIVRGIATDHGGSVAVETAQLGGARLRLTLPLG